MKKLILLLMAVLGLLAFSPAVQATVLTPGDSLAPTLEVSLPAGAYATGGGPFITSFTGNNALGHHRFSGTPTIAAYREPATGFRDLLYQVQNNSTSVSGIEHVASTDFTSSFVNATYLGAASSGFASGGNTPNLAIRSIDGGGVSFNFSQAGNVIQPGNTSRELVIHTHATTVTAGRTSLFDGGVASLETFSPVAGCSAPTSPEPSAWLLFTGRFAGLAAWSAWRRRKLLPGTA
jgi:hypothetical protein